LRDASGSKRVSLPVLPLSRTLAPNELTTSNDEVWPAAPCTPDWRLQRRATFTVRS